VDAILCTHPLVEHVGGLGYLFNELGASCPVYMTVAASTMTQVLFQDLLHSQPIDDLQAIERRLMGATEERTPSDPYSWNATTLRQVLGSVIGLRYYQPIHLTGNTLTN
jgi:Cft2 family RNA processing exonuclease